MKAVDLYWHLADWRDEARRATLARFVRHVMTDLRSASMNEKLTVGLKSDGERALVMVKRRPSMAARPLYQVDFDTLEVFSAQDPHGSPLFLAGYMPFGLDSIDHLRAVFETQPQELKSIEILFELEMRGLDPDDVVAEGAAKYPARFARYAEASPR